MTGFDKNHPLGYFFFFYNFVWLFSFRWYRYDARVLCPAMTCTHVEEEAFQTKLSRHTSWTAGKHYGARRVASLCTTFAVSDDGLGCIFELWADVSTSPGKYELITFQIGGPPWIRWQFVRKWQIANTIDQLCHLKSRVIPNIDRVEFFFNDNTSRFWPEIWKSCTSEIVRGSTWTVILLSSIFWNYNHEPTDQAYITNDMYKNSLS